MSSAGIGLSTVKFLVLRGAKVYFTARSKDKGDHTRTHLISVNPEIKSDQLNWLALDLADLKSVAAAIKELKTKEMKVDILSELKPIVGEKILK